MDLEDIKALIIQNNYDYSNKVRGFIEDGWYGEDDLEFCICHAEKIYKKEKDELKTAVDGKKYVIIGKDTHGRLFYTLGKVIKNDDGKLYFFITAHEADN